MAAQFGTGRTIKSILWRQYGSSSPTVLAPFAVCTTASVFQNCIIIGNEFDKTAILCQISVARLNVTLYGSGPSFCFFQNVNRHLCGGLGFFYNFGQVRDCLLQLITAGEEEFKLIFVEYSKYIAVEDWWSKMGETKVAVPIILRWWNFRFPQTLHALNCAIGKSNFTFCQQVENFFYSKNSKKSITWPRIKK